MSGMAILKDLASAGALSERIYGRKNEAEGDNTTLAANAKVDPNVAQVVPGSDAEKKAAAAASPSPEDDEEAGVDPEDDEPAAPPANVDVPMTFLLLSLTSTRGMVDVLEDMVGDLASRYGDEAIPVLNDVIFKVRTAHEMLQGLVEASHDADAGDSEDDASEDDAGGDDAAPAEDGAEDDAAEGEAEAS